MDNTGLIGMLLIGLNVIFSYTGFSNYGFFEKYKFQVHGIVNRNEYLRIFSSGFLHVSWTHLIFNMLTLYFFSDSIQKSLGIYNFLLIYFASLIGGNLLSLIIHRKNANYSAAGASGAISGIIFTSIAIYPGMKLSLMFIPVLIPGWLFGLLYVLYSIYGIKSQRDNIGHEAHLGGGIIGLACTLALFPDVLSYNPTPIALMAVPTIIFFLILILKPNSIATSNTFNLNKKYQTIDDKYQEQKFQQQKEIDRILDKINKVGVNNLTEEEKEILNKFQ